MIAGTERGRMDHGLSRSEIVFLVDEWILNDRDRNIIKRKLIDGITFEMLAEEQNLSVQRVKEIVSKGRKKILSHR